jgi:hypothetical protein
MPPGIRNEGPEPYRKYLTQGLSLRPLPEISWSTRENERGVACTFGEAIISLWTANTEVSYIGCTSDPLRRN